MGADFSFWLMLTVAVVTGNQPSPQGEMTDIPEISDEELPKTEKGSGRTGIEETAETINPEAVSTSTKRTAGSEGNNPEESLGPTAPPNENGRTIHEGTVAPNVRNTIEDENKGTDLGENVALIQSTPSDNVNGGGNAEKAVVPNVSTVTDDGHGRTDPEGNVALTEPTAPQNENGRTDHEGTVAPNVRNTIEDENKGTDLGENMALIQSTPSDNVNGGGNAEKAVVPNVSTVTDDGHGRTGPEGNVALTDPTAPQNENGRTYHEGTVAPNVRNTIEDENKGTDLGENVALIQSTPSDNVNGGGNAEKAIVPNVSTVTDDGHEGTDPEENVALTEPIVPENENRGIGSASHASVTSMPVLTEDEPLMSSSTTEKSFKNPGAKIASSLRQPPSHVSSKTSTNTISSVSPSVVGNEEESKKSSSNLDWIIENLLEANNTDGDNNTDAMMPSDSSFYQTPSDTLDKQPAADDGRGTEDNKNTLDDTIIKPQNGKFDATTNSVEIRGAGRNYVEESNVYKGRNDSLFVNSRPGSQGDGLISTPAVIREDMKYINPATTEHRNTYTENRPNSFSNPISKPTPIEQTTENKQISDKEINVLANKNDRDGNGTEQSNLAKGQFDPSNNNHRPNSQGGGVTNNSTVFTKNKMTGEPPKTNINPSVATETRANRSSNPTSKPIHPEQTEENKQISDLGKNKIVNKTNSGKGQGKGEENHRSPDKQPERKVNDSEVKNTTTTRKSPKVTTALPVQRKTASKPLQSASRRPKTGNVATATKTNITEPLQSASRRSKTEKVATATKTNITEPTTFKEKLVTLLGKAVTPLAYAACVFVGACIVASIFISF